MESAGLRRRQREQDTQPSKPPPQPPPAQTRTSPQIPRTRSSSSRLPASITAGYAPPRFTVNLSLPPQHRYTHIATALQPTLASFDFESLFAEAVALILPPSPPLPCLNTFIVRLLRALSRLFLRRVYSDEETAELTGIARDAGMAMDILVAFNVVLDLLMGCTSGGVRVQGADHDVPAGGAGEESARMVHFRTLDWDMDELRQLVVELEFVRFAGGPTVAKTVGYFGYVGVLTGVREGLSLSLNFRAGCEERGWTRRLGLRWHLGMVLLGKRRSVSSVLRGYMLGDGETKRRRRWWPWKANETGHMDMDGYGGRQLPDVDMILADLANSPSTAAYLIFCTPSKAYSVEKGYRTATVQSSSEFLTTCNHDVANEPDPSRIHAAARNVASQAMAEIIDESFERKQAVEETWKQRLHIRQKSRRTQGHKASSVNLDDVLHMLAHGDIIYGGTHYAVVMDPEMGEVLWRRVYRTNDLRGGRSESED